MKANIFNNNKKAWSYRFFLRRWAMPRAPFGVEAGFASSSVNCLSAGDMCKGEILFSITPSSLIVPLDALTVIGNQCYGCVFVPVCVSVTVSITGSGTMINFQRLPEGKRDQKPAAKTNRRYG